MGSKSDNDEWATKCAKIGDLARDLGLTCRFYSPTVFVVCSPMEEQPKKPKRKSQAERDREGDPPPHGEGGSSGEGGGESTLF